MDFIQQAKAKLKPPPPPKPSHLSSASDTTGPPTSTYTAYHSQKRGIGWPWDYKPDLFPLFSNTDRSKNVSWLFNWELWVPPSLPASITWTPCVRTASQCQDVIPFLTDISTNQGRSISHFLGFNEPEISTQANLSVDDAVRLWKEVVLPAKAKFKFLLGSPGMSSDEARSVAWLDGFFDRLGGIGRGRAEVDFLVLHWYGPRFADMQRFLEMMHGRYGLPVWVNEFACSKMGNGEAGQEEVEAFLREAVPWLERCDWIERYAYFGNGQGMDVGTWVGRASNFTGLAEGCDGTGGRKLSRTGRLYLEL